jgi:IS30 family transposase
MYGIPDIELEEIIMSNAKHLTRDDRVAIEKGLSLGLSKSQIAHRIDKDKSTVGNEKVLRHLFHCFKEKMKVLYRGRKRRAELWQRS